MTAGYVRCAWGYAGLMGMTQRDPASGRRERARYLALCRAQPGDDIESLTAEIITELENDPYDFLVSQCAATAPPPLPPTSFSEPRPTSLTGPLN